MSGDITNSIISNNDVNEKNLKIKVAFKIYIRLFLYIKKRLILKYDLKSTNSNSSLDTKTLFDVLKSYLDELKNQYPTLSSDYKIYSISTEEKNQLDHNHKIIESILKNNSYDDISNLINLMNESLKKKETSESAREATPSNAREAQDEREMKATTATTPA